MEKMPKKIILVSGKRKSGKDFICEQLKTKLGDERCALIRISEPLKRCYADHHQLNLKALMGDGAYKEQYRLDMINWSDAIRRTQPGYFCEAACEEAPVKDVWIVSDVRRKTDIEWFKDFYKNKIKTVRITADLETRTQRGFEFKTGVDDVASECDLDDYDSWDLVAENNTTDNGPEVVKLLLQLIEEA